MAELPRFPLPPRKEGSQVERLSKDNYLWSLAYAAAVRGTCDRFRAGCVIAREGILIATGYNGSAPGEEHCGEVGHQLEWRITSDQHPSDSRSPGQREYVRRELTTQHCVRTIHAEVNAVVNAAYLGVSIRGCDWYFTGVPCARCSRVILRLEPSRLFICSDGGEVESDKGEVITWWEAKQRTRLFVRSLEELRELGVVE